LCDFQHAESENVQQLNINQNLRIVTFKMQISDKLAAFSVLLCAQLVSRWVKSFNWHTIILNEKREISLMSKLVLN